MIEYMKFLTDHPLFTLLVVFVFLVVVVEIRTIIVSLISHVCDRNSKHIKKNCHDDCSEDN